MTAWLPTCAVAGEEVIQFDVSQILNARPVTTLAGQRLVPWTKGIDGGGKADGFMTQAAAQYNHDDCSHALPDDGKFPANRAHPPVQLHFNNIDSDSNQARATEGEGVFEFAIPRKSYRSLLLFFSTAEGSSTLSVTLRYQSGEIERRDVVIPDYYNDAPTDDPNIFSLARDLAKWNADGKMAEADHHFIHGVELHPAPNRIVQAIVVQKAAAGYLVFWGATGVTTTDASTNCSIGASDIQAFAR